MFKQTQPKPRRFRLKVSMKFLHRRGWNEADGLMVLVKPGYRLRLPDVLQGRRTANRVVGCALRFDGSLLLARVCA